MSDLLTTDEFWSLYIKRQRTREEEIKLNRFIYNGWGCSYDYGIARITHYIHIGNEFDVNPILDTPDEKEEEYQDNIHHIKRQEYYESYCKTHGEPHPCHNRVFDNEVGDIDYSLDNDNYTNDVYSVNDIENHDDVVYHELNLNDNFDPYGDGRNGTTTDRVEYLCDFLQRNLKDTGIQPEFCMPLSYYLCDMDYRVIKGVPFNRQSCNDEHIMFPYNISKITHAWKGKSPLDKYGKYTKKWLLLGQLTTGRATDNNTKYFYFWSWCIGDKFSLRDHITLHICDNYNMLINGALNTCDRRRLGIPPPSSPAFPSSSSFPSTFTLL